MGRAWGEGGWMMAWLQGTSGGPGASGTWIVAGSVGAHNPATHHHTTPRHITVSHITPGHTCSAATRSGSAPAMKATTLLRRPGE
jgi:hypothetical protein